MTTWSFSPTLQFYAGFGRDIVFKINGLAVLVKFNGLCGRMEINPQLPARRVGPRSLGYV